MISIDVDDIDNVDGEVSLSTSPSPNWGFDSICILDNPLVWVDREHVVREVYGFLYTSWTHIFDDFWFQIMYKLSHIIGSSKVIFNNGDIDEEQNIWTLSSGRMIDMSRPRIKELLVRLLKDSFSFRLVEFVDVIPYTIENRKGVIGDLIIDRDFISRVVYQTRLTEEKETGVDYEGE